jgi:Tfp pilus assembly protein PilN
VTRTVGIDVGRGEVRLAVAEGRLGRPRLTRLARLPLAGDVAATVLARAGLPPRAEARVALPATLVAHRVLTLPFRDRRRLARTVPLELRGRLAADVPDTVCAFEPLGADAAGTAVFAVAARAADVAARTDLLARAGLRSARVDLGALAPWVLVRPDAGDAALVVADGAQSALSVRRGGQPLALRALGADACREVELAAEVRWALAALCETPPVVILAGADASAALAEALAGATGLRVVPLADVATAEVPDLAACAVAAGLALGAGLPLGGAAAGTGSWRTARALAAAAAVLVVVDAGLWRARLAARDAALRDAIRATAAAVLPAAPLAAPRAELEAAVAALPAGGGPAPGALALLREASARVPAAVPLDLDRLVVEPGGLRLEGRAGSFDAVEALRQALAGSPLLADVAVDETRATVDGRGVAFRLRAARAAAAGTRS